MAWLRSNYPIFPSVKKETDTSLKKKKRLGPPSYKTMPKVRSVLIETYPLPCHHIFLPKDRHARKVKSPFLCMSFLHQQSNRAESNRHQARAGQLSTRAGVRRDRATGR